MALGWVVENLEYFVVPLIVGHVLFRRMGQGASVDCSPSFIASCACGGLDYVGADRPAEGNVEDVVIDLDSADVDAECFADGAPPAPAATPSAARPEGPAATPDAGPKLTPATQTRAPAVWAADVSAHVTPADVACVARSVEATASERAFLREFRALLDGGVELVARPSTDSAAREAGACVLTLGDRAIEWTYVDPPARAETLPLRAVLAVRPRPLADALGSDLASRSFMLVAADRAVIFHADSADVAGLCVDGLSMLVDGERRRLARVASLTSHKKARKKSLGAPAKKAPLSASN